MNWEFDTLHIVLIVLIIFHLLGLMHALHVLKHVRSSQGAIAWIGGLLTIPVIVVPLYWLSGRTRYHDYVQARKKLRGKLSEIYDKLEKSTENYTYEPRNIVLDAVSHIRYTHSTEGNELKLLIDAEEKFESVFEELRSAKEYILVEYFTIKDDKIGRKFKDVLIAQVKRGIRVYLLYDSFGSSAMSRSYIDDLKEAGVNIRSFGVKKKWLSRFQLNFRNHRKIIVIDGKSGFVGGINVGDEYLGRNEAICYWRDTHMLVKGPAVLGLQTVIVEDYYWGSEEVIDVKWDQDFSTVTDTSQKVASMASNPSDDYDTWQLTVAAAAGAAKEKLWISSPYLVPDQGVITALQTAVMRGVDVKIIYPRKSDQILVHYAAYTFQDDLIPIGVELHAYEKGFIHQKVVLVDDVLAMVGSANLDNRSFRLNFEIMMLSESEKFIAEVKTMLEKDLANSVKIEEPELQHKSLWINIFSNFARLFVPIL